VQVAGIPGRNEPDNGERLSRLFDVLDETGYDGWIGCEYRPSANTEAGLRGRRHTAMMTVGWIGTGNMGGPMAAI